MMILKRTKKILLITFFVLQAMFVQAQSDTTYTGDITVTTQAAVDALRDTLAGKTRIVGNVTIGYTSGNSHSNITDLTPLSNIVRITGNLRIRRNGQLVNLNALTHLQSIGGYFNVARHSELTDLGDFPVLQTIGGNFVVAGNRELTDLGDFPVLRSIGEDLWVTDNVKLTTLGNFSNLQTIGELFRIKNNNTLITLGDFSALTSIGLTSLLNIPSLGERRNNVSIIVEDNSSLSDCYTLAEFLPGGSTAVSGEIYINNNATGGGCNSPNGIINSIYQGNITVTTQAEVDAMRDTLAGKTRINGNLTIGYTSGSSRSNITDLTPLSNMTYITGNLIIRQNERLNNINDLTHLQSIGGYFSVYNNTELTDLGDFSNLQTIGGYFLVQSNDTLTTMGNFPVLQTIGGYFDVLSNDLLTTLGNFPVLQTIGGYFNVSGNSDLTDLGDFPVLQTIGGFFLVNVNSELTDLGDFPVLQTIGGEFNVRDNSELTDLGDFPVLQTIGGYFSVYNNSELTDLGDFPVLQTIGGYFSVYNNSELTDLGDFPALTSIGVGAAYVPSLNGNRNNVSMVVENNSSLSDCYTLTDFLPGGAHAVSGGIYINDNAGVCTDQSALSNTIYRGDITVTTQAAVDALRDILAGKTRIVGNVTIGYTDGFTSSRSNITDLTPLSNITDITGNLNIENNEQLNNLSNLNNLQSIGGFFYVNRNDSLTDLGDFSTLQTIGGDFSIGSIFVGGGNDRLTTLGDFSNLQTIGGYFLVQSNDTLTTMGNFPVLQTIGGYFDVLSNDLLTTLGNFPVLQSIGERFSVGGNSELTDLGDFPVLQTIGGDFSVSSNNDLTDLGDFPVLQTIGGYFSVYNNSELTDLGDFPVLQTIGGYFSVYNNSELTDLGDFPVLQTIGGYFSVYNNSELTDLGDFPALTSIGVGAAYVPSLNGNRNNVSMVVENNSSLSDCYTLTDFLPGGAHAVSGGIYINDNAGVCTDQSALSNTIYRGDITVTTQAAVDALRTTLAGKTRINGNVTIGYTDVFTSSRSNITDLTPLSNITDITGNLNIENNEQLNNLSNLNNLQTIGGDFSVRVNSELTDLGDFSTLQTIGGDFSIGSIFVGGGNDRLTTLGDFPVLQTIGGYFRVYENTELTDLGDFPVLQTIGGDFNVFNNDTLTDLGDFPVLQTIGGYFQVSSNNDLTDLGDFPVLQSIGGYFQVSSNNDLTDLGDFSVLQTIGGDFWVSSNTELTDLGDFPVLQTIGGFFNVSSNSDLTDLGDFSTLQTIGGDFSIGSIFVGGGNDRLTTLGDFSNLQTIGGYFLVQSNDTLTTMGNFPVLQTIGGDFNVFNNDTLTDLGDFPVLQTIGGYFSVVSNDSLTTLGNFSALTSIGVGNLAVPSLGRYTSNVSIVVENNSSLSDCYTLAEFLPDGSTVVSGKIYINNNALGCNSESDIIASAPHTIMLTSHTEGDSIAIAYNEVSAQTIMFSIGGGATGWTSEITGDDFITLDTTMNVADTGVVITVRATPTKNTGVERSAVITFTTVGGTGVAKDTTVTITQSAAPPSLVLTSPSTVTLAHDVVTAQTIGFTVGGSALGWTSEMTGDNFIDLTDDGNVTGNVVVTATPRGANTGVERSAVITFTTVGGTGVAKDTTVTITQSAAPPSLVLTSPSTVTLAHDVVTAQTIEFAVGGSALGWTSEMTGDNFIDLTDDGNVTGDITVTATPRGANTGVERSAVITFTTVGGTGVAKDTTVTITQSAAPPSLVLSSGATVTLGYDASTAQTITFTVGGSASGWTSEMTGYNFIDLTDDGNVTGNVVVTATPRGANTGVERSATIMFTTSGGVGDAATATVTITQAAAPPMLTLTSGATVMLAHDASTAQIITFTVGGSASGWASEITGENFITLLDDGNETGAVVVIATPSANTGVERSATITFTTEGGTGDVATAMVTITQAAAPPSLVLSSPSTITLGYDASRAQTITFTVGGSASGWASEITGENFITLSDDGNETGDVTVTATPTENTGVARSATIRITTMGGTGAAATFTVTIRQAAAPPMLTLTSGATVTLAHNASTAQTITFTVGGSATGWASSMSGENFITLSDDGNETGDVTVTATPSANTGVERSATITFTTSGGVGDAATATVTITQDGSPPTIRLISKNRETLAYDETTETAIMFEVGGGATAWWAGVIDGDSDNNFVMLDKISGSAGLDTIKVTTAENTGEARVDTVVVGTGGEGEATDTIIVTQEAIPTIVVTDPIDGMITINHDVVDAQFITFDVGGSATGWVASSDQGFVRLDTMGSSGTGIEVTATPMENVDVERSATIILMTTGQLGEARTATVTITQLELPGSPILKITPPSGVSDTVAYTATTTSDSVEIMFTVENALGWESMISYGDGVDEFITLSETVNAAQVGEVTIKAAVTENEGVERSATITLSTTGQYAAFSAATREITIIQRGKPNQAPTDIMLSNNTIAENQLVGSTIGILATIDPDAGDRHFYSLTTPNDTFLISGDTLKTNRILDFETKSSYTLSITTDDQNGGTFDKIFTITVQNVNEAPTDIGLVGDRIDENISVFSVLSTTDPDAGDTHTYTLSGTDSSFFNINGPLLRFNTPPDFENPDHDSTYVLTITTNDGNGGTLSKDFTLTVVDINEPPTNITLTNNTIAENQPAGTTIGTLRAEDPDNNETRQFFFVDSDNIRQFRITDDSLLQTTSTSLNYEEDSTFTLKIYVTDKDGLTDTMDLVINVQNVNEAPTALSFVHDDNDDNRIDVNENSSVGTLISTLTTIDTDIGDTHNYALGNEADASAFRISKDSLLVNQLFNFEADPIKRSYFFTLTTTDLDGLSIMSEQLIISINNVNEAPTGFTISGNPANINENRRGVSVVTFSSVQDPDAGDAHTFSIAEDNVPFDIVGTELRTHSVDSIDYETQAQYTLTIIVTDQGNLTFQQTLTVDIGNLNDENPTDITLSSNTISENLPANTLIGTLTSIDPDDGGTPTTNYNYFLTGSDAAHFRINSNRLLSRTANFDFETKTTYNITITSGDRNGGTFMKDFTITIRDSNDPPTDIALSSDVVRRDAPIGTVIGNFTATDQDNGDSHTFTLTSDIFQIVGDTLKTKALLQESSYSISVTADDGNEGTYSQDFTITTENRVPPTLRLISRNRETLAYDETTETVIEFVVGGGATGWRSSITYIHGGDFITLDTVMNANQTGDVTVRATPMDNTGVERTALIAISTMGGTGVATNIIIITQESAPTIALSTSRDIHIAYNEVGAQLLTFSVGGSATGWIASSDQDFVTLNNEIGDLGTGIEVLATPTINNGVSPRTATITISTTGQLGMGKTATVMLTQDGAPASPVLVPLSFTDGDSVSISYDSTTETVIEFVVGGGATGWSVSSSNEDFITINPSMGAPGQDISVTAIPEGKNTGVERMAVITLSTLGPESTSLPVTATLTIVQGGASPVLSLTSEDRDTLAYDAQTASDITFTLGGGASGWSHGITYSEGLLKRSLPLQEIPR